ncbi:short-chain collagen C4-like [Corticium candelabrum]|uniref:short-chain collagen C4-like n=1 Tax=Corticium candelabrum TaxID=121492 RepID=UPI002E25418E|nr:short-chain collagen C4-like [Corticium candelabrum]
MTVLKIITLSMVIVNLTLVNTQEDNPTGSTESCTCSGLPGIPGRDGLPGRDGIRGDPGISGIPGKRGGKGKKGDIGPTGPKGRKGKGKPGRPGPAGSKGGRGDVGPAGIKGAKGEAGTPARDPTGTSGVTYIQWGRKKCSAHGVHTLYSGVAAGSKWSQGGGGANTQCLPLDPTWGNYRSGIQGASYIYGAEYEFDQEIYLFINRGLHDHDVPCAVCYAATKNTQFMLPAKNICPSGWSRAYYGYLMAERYSHSGRSMYHCVDYNAEGTVGSSSDNDGNAFYPVEAVCGSLPCPPYVHGRELTCSVCLK